MVTTTFRARFSQAMDQFPAMRRIGLKQHFATEEFRENPPSAKKAVDRAKFIGAGVLTWDAQEVARKWGEVDGTPKEIMADVGGAARIVEAGVAVGLAHGIAWHGG